MNTVRAYNRIATLLVRGAKYAAYRRYWYPITENSLNPLRLKQNQEEGEKRRDKKFMKHSHKETKYEI